jgi:hypothetical protein
MQHDVRKSKQKQKGTGTGTEAAAQNPRASNKDQGHKAKRQAGPELEPPKRKTAWAANGRRGAKQMAIPHWDKEKGQGPQSTTMRKATPLWA